MSTAEKRRLTPAEYLAIEVASEGRHEFRDGEMFAMSGGSYWHNLVKDNLAHALGNLLAGRGCTVLTSDQRVKVDATGLSTYPDDVVFCGKPVFEDGMHYSAVNPLVLAEVLSDSTEKVSSGREVRPLPPAAERPRVSGAGPGPRLGGAVSAADGGRPRLLAADRGHPPAGSVAFESLGIAVPVAEIYAGVEFPVAG